MTSTISSFRSDVRKVTNDTSAVSYHHTDADIDLFVVDAFRHLYAVRPESRYNEEGRIDDVVFPTVAADIAVFSVTYEERWRMGIVYYAASRAFENDVTDSVNRELSAGYLQKADAEFMR